jgi:hypothetical protein
MSQVAEEQSNLAGLAAIVNSRLGADARLAKAIGFGWLCAGVGIGGCLAASGIAIGLFGYSYMISIRPAAEQIAKSVAETLQQVKLTTTVSGTMALSPKSELKLAPGQSIKLADHSVVQLDPNSSVRVIGDVKMPQPSSRQLQPDIRSGDVLPFTSYTIFRSIDYGAGRVETGWNFELSDTSRPRSQYCSYIQDVTKGAQIKDVIAVNGVERPPAPNASRTYNFIDAVAKCIWFSGI